MKFLPAPYNKFMLASLTDFQKFKTGIRIPVRAEGVKLLRFLGKNLSDIFEQIVNFFAQLYILILKCLNFQANL